MASVLTLLWCYKVNNACVLCTGEYIKGLDRCWVDGNNMLNTYMYKWYIFKISWERMFSKVFFKIICLPPYKLPFSIKFLKLWKYFGYRIPVLLWAIKFNLFLPGNHFRFHVYFTNFNVNIKFEGCWYHFQMISNNWIENFTVYSYGLTSFWIKICWSLKTVFCF